MSEATRLETIARTDALRRRIRALPEPAASTNIMLGRGVTPLDAIRKMSLTQSYGPVNTNPDFQRGHVWTREQQVGFVEALIRGTVRLRDCVFRLNIPAWTCLVWNHYKGDLPHEIQLIDGLQRLTAISAFMQGEFTIFDGLGVADIENTHLALGGQVLTIQIYSFEKKADLLQFYLDINTGGTVHSEAEIARVKELLSEAKAGARP